MDNDHNIKDLNLLYSDSNKLINEIVVDNYDNNILKSTNEVLTKINEDWHGKDATMQINNLIDAKNLMIDNREIVGNIGVYISSLVKTYRDAQNSNGQILPAFKELTFNRISKSEKTNNTTTEIFMNKDITNTISIINNIANDIEELNNSISQIKESIFNNWLEEDENRNYALRMFEKYTINSNNIVKIIDDISKNIRNAIDNYNNINKLVASNGSLESMFENKTKSVEAKEVLTTEEQKVVESVNNTLEKNRQINKEFKESVIEAVKKDLKDKGIIE